MNGSAHVHAFHRPAVRNSLSLIRNGGRKWKATHFGVATLDNGKVTSDDPMARVHVILWAQAVAGTPTRATRVTSCMGPAFPAWCRRRHRAGREQTEH